jgi:hypothetical protein
MKNSFVKLLITLSIIGLMFPMSASAAGGLSFISIPAAAFQPTSDCIYFNHNAGFSTLAASAGGCSSFIAPVMFPDGVSVKKVTFYWKDFSVDYQAFLRLCRLNRNGVGENIATVSSNGSANVASSSSVETSIVIDNYQYSYYISIQMPTDANAVIYGALIEYSYDTALPIIIK